MHKLKKSLNIPVNFTFFSIFNIYMYVFQNTTVILAKIYVQITTKITLQSWNPLNCEYSYQIECHKIYKAGLQRIKAFCDRDTLA